MQLHDNFFRISQDTWTETVEKHYSETNSKLASYLQWYPFTKKELKKVLVNDNFYNTVIKKGYFLFDKNQIMVEKNYLQKSDSTYRKSQLVSPILYLLLESICAEIYNEVGNEFDHEHSFYAGHIENQEISYEKQYNRFYKEVNRLSSIFTHYIKFDIENFYRNIDLNLLFDMIENKSEKFTQFQIYIYKEFIEYIGEGLFPIIENSTGLSYLATKIYLHEVDKKMKEYLATKFNDYAVLRYVDDLYIFFNEEHHSTDIHKKYIDIKNYYMMALRDINLDLNTKKSGVHLKKHINKDVQKSFYDGQIYDEEINIHKLSISHFVSFLEAVEKKMINEGNQSLDEYHNLINENFKIEGVELIPRAAFKYIIYNKEDEFKNNNQIKRILDLIIDTSIITYDVKMFVIAILHTREGTLIKKFLNNLFTKDQWTDVDNHAAIVYLLQRNFRHEDLKEKIQKNLKDRDEKLYRYIDVYCEPQSKVEEKHDKSLIDISSRLKITPNTMHLYFLHCKSKKDNDYLLAYAYYKSFFDRLTAELVWEFDLDGSGKNDMKKPNYKRYYEEKNLKRVYKEISNSEEIIKKAHNIRNSNPVIHSSATLIKDSFSKKDLEESISQLDKLTKELVLQHISDEDQ